MSSQDALERLRQKMAIRPVRDVRTGDSEERRREPPRAGDVLVLRASATREQPVFWAVLRQDADRYLLVAADHHPFVGSADVAVPAESECGAMTLRCAFHLSAGAEDLGTAGRIGSLDEDLLERARQKQAAVAAGELCGSFREQEIDEEWEYRYHLLENLEDARTLVAESFGAIEPWVVEILANRCMREILTLSAVVARAHQARIDGGDLRFLRRVHKLAGETTLALPDDADPGDLRQTGWAVVFHADESAEVRRALEPLVAHRRRQAGDDRVHLLEYRTGESWRQFLARHGVAADETRIDKVPYYLLLMGSPKRIPWDVQQMLAVEYAVGRLSFDTPEEYRRYAESLIAEETGETPRPRGTVLLAPREDDSSDKDALDAALHGDQPPVFLVASTSGLVRPPKHPDARAGQGALLCRRPETMGLDPNRDFYGAADLDDGACVRGLTAILGASYSAGSDEGFVAALPRRLLAHPRGSALAVIGLMDRSWGTGSPEVGRRLLDALRAGAPAGHTLREVKKRHVVLSITLADFQEKIEWGADLPPDELAAVWREWSETRAWVVLGDPAARAQPEERAAF